MIERQPEAGNKGWPGHPVHLIILPRAGLRWTHPALLSRGRPGVVVASSPKFPSSPKEVRTAPPRDRSRNSLFLGFHLGHSSCLGHLSIPSGSCTPAPNSPLSEASLTSPIGSHLPGRRPEIQGLMFTERNFVFIFNKLFPSRYLLLDHKSSLIVVVSGCVFLFPCTPAHTQRYRLGTQ